MKLNELLDMSIFMVSIQIYYKDRVIYSEHMGGHNREEIINKLKDKEIIDIDFFVLDRLLYIEIQ